MSGGLRSRPILVAVVAFLLVVAIGELLALLSEYQNNRFFQDYVSANLIGVVAEVAGLVVVGIGVAFFAFRLSTRPSGAKRSSPFSRLGQTITRRHRVVIVVWLVLLVASVPLATRLSDALTAQTSTSTANPTEAQRAQTLIGQVFPRPTANSTGLIVITGSDVTDNATKKFVLDLETQLSSPGTLTYVENTTTVYSTERTILVSTLRALAPVVYGLVVQFNATAFLVYGVPSIYVANWITANQTSPSTADSVANSTTWSYLNSPPVLQQMGPNAPLVLGFYKTFYGSWAGFASNLTLVHNPFLRATVSINGQLPGFAAGLPPAQAGFVTAAWKLLSLTTWNKLSAIIVLVQNVMTNLPPPPGFPPIPPLSLSLIQSIYSLGPNPSNAAVQSLAVQIVNTGTLSTYPFLPQALASQFISSNKGTMLVIVTFTKAPATFGASGADPILKNVVDMRQVVSNLMSSDPGPQRVYVTGDAATTADSSSESSKDIQRIDPVTIGAILVLVGIFFVAIVTPLVPLTAIGLALVVAQGVVYLVSTYVVPVESTTVTFLTTIMLGVGTDYAIFLIARYREERVEGKEKADAVRTSVTWVGESITTSGMTVILAFGAMALGSFSLLRSMGIGIGSGVLIALIVSLTLIPAILTLAGDKVFWPNSGKRFDRYAARVREKRATRPSYFRRAASFSANRPKLVLLLALLVTLPAVYISFTANTTYDFIAGLPSSESVQGLTALQQGFGAGRIGPTQVVVQFQTAILQGRGLTADSGRALEKLASGIAGLNNVAEVQGPTRPEGTPINATDLTKLDPTSAAAIHGSIGNDNRTALLTVIMAQEPFTSASLNTVQEIRNTVSALRSSDPTVGNAQILVGGQSASTADFAQQTVDQFTIMRIVVIAGIFVILLLVLGSYVLPVAAILTIGMSIVWSYAATLVFFSSVLNSQVLFIIPLILFLLLFGIGMDYNIFILTRIREEAQKGKGAKDAVVDAVDRTGGIITALALILGAAIGSLMLSSNRLLQGFGFAISLAVVLDAMVVRTYLVPAIMSLLGRWAWWGPKPLQRVKFERKLEPGPEAKEPAK